MEKLTTAHDTLPVCAGAGYCVDPSDAEAPAGYDRVVPVVFACNEQFAPYAGVAIQSVLENAGAGNFYRVYVLHSSLSDDTIRLLESIGSAQLSVRCLNVELLIQNKNAVLYENSRISKEAYYRILIPEIFDFYPQVIYLDCDVVVNRDIAEILPRDMGDMLIGAVQDQHDLKQRERVTNVLHLNPKRYFNTGVLVFNVKQWALEKTVKECFAFLETALPEQVLFHDQDVLNTVCRNRVLYLEPAWNYCWYMRYGRAFCHYKPLVDKIGEDFYVLHFATNLKPWRQPELPLSRYFWKYAASTVFYQRILQDMAENSFAASKLRKELTKQKAEADRLRKQNARLKHDLDSASFRVGRAITFVPRKLRGGVKCLQEHGAAYTFDRLLVHLRIKK